MTVTVRPVVAGDKDDWAALWRAYLAFYETERSQAVQDRTWARIMAGERGMFAALAVDADERAVGLVNFLYHPDFWEQGESCYLGDLFVRPEIRGIGAGRALIEYVADHATTRGASGLYWLTARDNATARALYDRIATASPFMHYTRDLAS